MSHFIEQRQVLFQKMARIEHMEYGSLQAEYRPGTDPHHPLGPHYKYPGWEEGKNHSQRVARPPARQPRQAASGRQQFDQLAQECIALSVAHPRQRSSATDAKK